MLTRRQSFVALAAPILAGFHSGCGPEQVEVKKVAPSEVTQAPPPAAPPKPLKGSSGAMNYNPGGPPPGSPSDDEREREK